MGIEQVSTVLANIATSTINFIEPLTYAVVLLIIGLVIGKVLGRVVKEVLDKAKLDYYVTERKKPDISISALLALAARWWVYLAFIGAAVGVLQIRELTEWTLQIRDIIPGIIGASVVIITGFVLAEYIRGQLKKLNKIYAEVVGKILLFFILYVAIATALPVLGITAPLVNNILLIMIGSVAIGVAIALGLGLKDAVSEISKRYVKRLKV